jgi:hypothetical protein
MGAMVHVAGCFAKASSPQARLIPARDGHHETEILQAMNQAICRKGHVFFQAVK